MIQEMIKRFSFDGGLTIRIDEEIEEIVSDVNFVNQASSINN